MTTKDIVEMRESVLHRVKITSPINKSTAVLMNFFQLKFSLSSRFSWLPLILSPISRSKEDFEAAERFELVSKYLMIKDARTPTESDFRSWIERVQSLSVS